MDQFEALTEAKKRAKHYNVKTWVAYNPDSMALDWFDRYICTDMPGDYRKLELKIEVWPNGKTIQLLRGEMLHLYFVQNKHKYFNPDNVLIVWPQWVSYDDVEELVKMGLMTREFGGPDTYGHVTYTLVDNARAIIAKAKGE